MRNLSPYKKCPRCKERCFQHEKSCHECGLVFERLNYTSNKSAKKLILKGNYKDTIKTADWPPDAKKSTALLLCLFLGYTGAHNFYLGRFIKAGVSLFGFVLAIVMVILTDYIYGSNLWYILRIIAIIPGTCVLIFWFSDLIAIIFERYKIPVAINEGLYSLKAVVLSDKNAEPVENLKFDKNNKLKENKKDKSKESEEIPTQEDASKLEKEDKIKKNSEVVEKLNAQKNKKKRTKKER